MFGGLARVCFGIPLLRDLLSAYMLNVITGIFQFSNPKTLNPKQASDTLRPRCPNVLLGPCFFFLPGPTPVCKAWEFWGLEFRIL